MSLTDIMAFLKGSVTIEAEGRFLERFLNICMRRGIFLSDVKRKSPELLSAKMGIGGFKEIRPIAKKTRTRVRIKTRQGIPFLIRRYKSRKMIIVGVMVFFVILRYLSTHIIGIDIVGNERLSYAEIENELKGFGLFRGAPTSKIDRRLVQNQMMTKLDELAWIGINIKGSRAYIEVKERLNTKVSIDEDVPCNIIARRDGMIRGLVIRSGQTVVRLGDMVEKGDLLVSGAMDSQVEGIRYAHSSGEVYAETIYKKSRVYPLKYEEKVYSGNLIKRRSIGVLGKTIKLHLKNAMPYEYFEKESKSERHHLWGFKNIYFDIYEDSYKEYTPKKMARTVNDAVEKGKEELIGEMQKEIDQNAEILSKNVTYREVEQECVEVTAEILCREDISQQSLIDKIENIDYNITKE